MFNRSTINASLTRTVHRAAGEVLGRLAARPARLLLRTLGVQQKTVVLALALSFSAGGFAATPSSTPINNTATAAYSVGSGATLANLTTSATRNVNTASCIDVGVKVELLQFIPPARAAQAPANAISENVQTIRYLEADGVTLTLPPIHPTLLNATTPLTLPSTMLLAPISDAASLQPASYSRNEPIFVRVVSLDANANAALAETVQVTLTTLGGDKETIEVTETGLSTGVFVGVVASKFAAIGSAPILNDGQISVSAHNETITGVYWHVNCATGRNTSNSSSGLIDPYGIVFDSVTGVPVDGAIVRLFDTATNTEAKVFCDDAVTVLTSTLPGGGFISGAPTNCDTVMVQGGFRFPQVPAGSYKITVEPPVTHMWPSIVPAKNLPAQIGVPSGKPAILGTAGAAPGGSYGGVFTLWGPALKIDMPVDSGGKVLTIQKTAGKAAVGTGEFLPYTLSIKNNSLLALSSVNIADHMPPGFRYQKGSTKVDGVLGADPAISGDGNTLTFNLNIAAGASIEVRYVLEVTAGAHVGTAENTANGVNFSSNTGRAFVLVREDLYRNKAILVGRVIDVSAPDNGEFADKNGAQSVCDARADNDLKGLKGARVVLQDGTYILSDDNGRWHIDNLRAGTHVVQLDLDSLPKDYEVVSCEKNDRFAGRLYSQFVNLQGGTLWRADFHVRKKPSLATRFTQTLSARAQLDNTLLGLSIVSTTEVTGYSATVMLPEYAKYVAGSAKLNGVAVADPVVTDGMMVFRSLARPAKWQDQYTFDVADVGPNVMFQSMVRFTPPGRPAQTAPVARINMRNHATISAGSDAVVLAEKADSRPPKTAQDDDMSRLIERLPYNETWLSTAPAGNEWLHPQASFHPNLPIVKVAVKHDPKHSLKITVNGEPVSALLYDGKQANTANTVAVSKWSAIPLQEGDNAMALVIFDAAGQEVSREVRNIHFASTPDHVEFLPAQSRLLADGKTRPVLAVRFLDKDGYPVRRGISGEFDLNEPYRSYDRKEGFERQPLTGRVGGKARYEIKTDGIAMIELEPTTQTGDAVLMFQFNDKRTQQVRAWLEPGQRDWILVGFAEGTVGYKALSGNVTALQANQVDKELFDGNKVAFYAKGTIKGEYLLTAAYDTSKQLGIGKLKQAVDPTQYYTLYGDATQAQHDAASSSRLYVKIERKQFYAMFGDYDTGLTVTELSRYSRTVNGLKSEYKGEQMGYNAFATVTSQAYIKDEIQGNGTSGLYKMSRGNIVMNADKIRIETRDRFQSQVIVSTKSLTRYLDYDIDYYFGTLNFREPIQSRDAELNPTYIVAEYESADPLDSKATYGGRGNFKPIKGMEVGVTAVHEGTVGATGNLSGVDATYEVTPQTKVRAELAGTDGNRAGNVSSGKSWLGEVTHHEEVWDGKLYVREQDGAFGLGQQAPSEIATRKIGFDGRLKLGETTQVRGQAYQQANLLTGAKNTVADARVNEQITDALNAYYGARTSRDTSLLGTRESNQALAGASYAMLDRKLTLRAAGEMSFGTAGSVPMPNRLILGADYQLTQQTKAFAEHEIARGEKIAADTSRVGLRTQPWQGAEMSASVANTFSNDAERMYGNLGMVQRWQINEHWQTDFSVDRTQTLRNSAAPLQLNTPLPSGNFAPAAGFAGDFTAYALGAAYNDTLWSANARAEVRKASLGNQNNLLLGMQRNLDDGRSLAVGYVLREVNVAASDTFTRNTDLRLSYAHRPNDSAWVWYDRADFITQKTLAPGSALKGDKLVNNFNANWVPVRHTQIALQYGSKYVLDTIDAVDYSGYTDLIGAEARHDLNQDWDVGVHGSAMRSWHAGVNSYGVGASVGYKVMDNVWGAIGYNMRGMNDRDFAGANYRAKGPYLTLRMKVDQDTFGLNDSGERTRPLSGE